MVVEASGHGKSVSGAASALPRVPARLGGRFSSSRYDGSDRRDDQGLGVVGAKESLLFGVVVGLRFLVPLFIPRYPLPAVIASLLLDAVDHSIFQAFGYDPPHYQSYDKAMDVYYLAIAYMSTLRNWTSPSAYRVGRFLYFYRLVGVMAFELSGWRSLLLIFPNTFEYFFIAYEVLRMQRDPRRYVFRFWVWLAAVIWVVVKLPQEWWIHVAQLDFTDELQAHPWMGPTIVAALVVAGGVYWWYVRPRLSPPDWPPRLAADPIPAEMTTWRQRATWTSANSAILSSTTAEKVALVGLISVIYGEALPGLDAKAGQLFVGIGALVVLNAAISIWGARVRIGTDNAVVAFAARVAVNVVLVLVGRAVLGGDRMDLAAAFFFVVMLSLLTLMHDRFLPVHAVRVATDSSDSQPQAR
jgi:hypothetical protein